MFHYVLFDDEKGALGVAMHPVPKGTNAIEMFPMPTVIPPRSIPVECLSLFAPNLKQEHMPAGVDLKRLRDLAASMLRLGWYEAREAHPERPGNVVPLGRLTGEEFAGLSDILGICDLQSEDAVVRLGTSENGLHFRPKRVRAILSRLRTEGQLAFASPESTGAAA